MRDLLPWQFGIVDYCKGHPLSFLGVEKRLGKCICSIRWALHHLPRKGRCLIVAPYSAIPGWLDDLDADGLLSWDLTDNHNMKMWLEAEGNLPGQFFITNPQGLFKAGRGEDPQPKLPALYPWQGCIWDETTLLANPQSQTSKVAEICLGDIPLRCGLSGEYVTETPLQVFNQMKWIYGSFMGHTNWFKWRNEYFEQCGFEWLPKPDALAWIKKCVWERGFVLSRKDAGLDKIAPTYDRRYCALPPKPRKAYDHAERYFEIPADYSGQVDGGTSDIPVLGAMGGDYRRDLPTYTKYIPVVTNWLVQITGGFPKDFPKLHSPHKMHLLLELLQGELSHEPVVVSFRHNAEMKAVYDLLSQKKDTGGQTMIWGDLDVAERRIRTQKFRDRKIRIMLKQSRVNYGMDLSAADTMIRYSLPDSGNDLSQDRDRIVHPKKTTPLSYVDLVVKDTLDEDIARSAAEKKINSAFFMEAAARRFKQRMEGLSL